MWMSTDKRRLMAKETSGLPYLTGISKEVAHLASQVRDEILEVIFDKFIRPDDAQVDVSTTSRWKRARQLWKTLLAEKRASYFVDLKASRFLDWIRTGETTVLPCTTEEMETLENGLPAIQGSKEAVRRAREIRATLLKHSDELERALLARGGKTEDRQQLEKARGVLRSITDAEWFLQRQPGDFAQYEKLLRSLMKG